MDKDIGQIIRSLRKEKAVTLRNLEQRTGFSHSYISQIERGGRIPSFKILKEIAEALDVSKIYLYKAAGYLDETDILNLVDENKRLREALNGIAKMQLSDEYSDAYYNEQYFNIVKHARQALEGEQHEPSTD